MMIIIDTNVAMEYKKLRLFFKTSELAITRPCLTEIKSQSGEKKDRLLSELVEKIKVIETESKTADSSIIEAAGKYNLAVATFDKILVKRLRSKNIKVFASTKEFLSEFGL